MNANVFEPKGSVQGYHHNHNAETYLEVGNALGWAMADLLNKNVSPQKWRSVGHQKEPGGPI